MLDMKLLEFKDIHKGQAAWIVGKGLSLEKLKHSDIGDGIIITLNSAIIKIEELEFNNVTYSMQKDGSSPWAINNCMYQTCEHCPYGMPMPKKAILLVHELESINCKPDYKPRYVFNNNDLGLAWNDFSALSSIRLAQYFGCNKFNFVSFDAVTHGDIKNTYDEVAKNGLVEYMHQAIVMKEFIKDLNHKFITPC